MTYKLLYAGFDTLDIAFAGALPPDNLATLEKAREQALKRQEPVLAAVGSAGIKMHVLGYGKRGGYAFISDSGPLGTKWMFKNNVDSNQWNIFASPRATMLLAYGYEGTRNRLWEALEAMGATVTNHSINRVDFAMDFRTQNFELHQEQFIAHSHTKVGTHWGELGKVSDGDQPGAIFRGRRLESVTIGKQPGRQIIVYDKRREAIEKQKSFWFETWGVDRRDPFLEVWRIEVRAGKCELKDKYQVRTFEDFEAGIGDIIMNTLEAIRYVDGEQRDSNVSRHALHPLWIAAQKIASASLIKFRSGLTPDQVRQTTRAHALNNYRNLCISNGIGWGIAAGLSDKELQERLPVEIAEQMCILFRNERKRIKKSIRRARERLHFLQEAREY